MRGRRGGSRPASRLQPPPVMRPLVPAFGLVFGLGIVLALGGCPKGGVNQFTVEPQLICAGQTIRLAWTVDGASATLRAERSPGDFEDHPVAPNGSETATPTVNTSYTLFAG